MIFIYIVNIKLITLFIILSKYRVYRLLLLTIFYNTDIIDLNKIKRRADTLEKIFNIIVIDFNNLNQFWGKL